MIKMRLREKREQFENSRTILIIEDTAIDMDKIKTIVKETYQKLCDNVGKWKKEGNYSRIFIGGVSLSALERSRILSAYNQAIVELGYVGDIKAEADSFSSVGDPFYMGEPEHRISYFIKIKEI